MKFCADHWAICRKAVDDRGMTGLVAKDGKTAADDAVADLQGEPDPKHERFDPLMSLHWHWTNSALRAGGLWVIGEDPSGKNDGEYCPICIYCDKEPGFIAEEAIGTVADQMAQWARTEGLIPRLA